MAPSIALGSAAQIALFVAPVLVLVSYLVGPEPMALQFWRAAVTMMLMTSLAAIYFSNGGRGARYAGVMALAVHAISAFTLFLLPPLLQSSFALEVNQWQ